MGLKGDIIVKPLRFVFIITIFAILVFSASITSFAAEESIPEASQLSQSESSANTSVNRLTYFVSGYAYGFGCSRVSYYLPNTVITVSGPTGILMTCPVNGMGYFDIPTQAGVQYTAYAPGYATSYWISN